jgi:predicted HTH transcriptional regulator
MQDIYNNHKDIGLFNNGDYLSYSFKKTEKIVSAIYIVTNLIKDNEPMKWELREGCMSLLSIAMALNGVDSVDRNKLLQTFFTSSIQLISFLNISANSGLISVMNSSIIINEIGILIDYLKHNSKYTAYPAGFILSDTFFATDIIAGSGKGQAIGSTAVNKDKNHSPAVKDRKSDRKNDIINLLRKSSDLTIKDFVKVITDCSEKTIQRELIDLVEKGVVKKKGERRWSTYSLA